MISLEHDRYRCIPYPSTITNKLTIMGMVIKNKIILVGAGASGKDYMSGILTNGSLKKEISLTTRPPRPNEVDGVDYHFVSENEMLKQICNGDMQYYQYFDSNNCVYGTLKKSFDHYNVFIMEPKSLAGLPHHIREGSLVIYLKPDDVTVMDRLMARDPLSAVRRFDSDKILFNNFNNHDVCFDNGYTIDDITRILYENTTLYYSTCRGDK